MIGSLIALALATQPQDALFAEQAARCRIRTDQIVWTKEADGKATAWIEIKDGPDAVPFAAIRCLAKWSLETGNRLGFMSDPGRPPIKPNGSQPPSPDRRTGCPDSCRRGSDQGGEATLLPHMVVPRVIERSKRGPGMESGSDRAQLWRELVTAMRRMKQADSVEAQAACAESVGHWADRLAETASGFEAKHGSHYIELAMEKTDDEEWTITL